MTAAAATADGDSSRSADAGVSGCFSSSASPGVAGPCVYVHIAAVLLFAAGAGADAEAPSSDVSNGFDHSPAPGFGPWVYVLIASVAAVILLAVAAATAVIVCYVRVTRRRSRPARVKHASSGSIPAAAADFKVAIPPLSPQQPRMTNPPPPLSPPRMMNAPASPETNLLVWPMSPAAAEFSWGRWYTAAELEAATGGFAECNVVGEGGYGLVYRGVLPSGDVVAVKNLFNQRGQAEMEFKVEVEVIGKIRHKNLVGLLGYCAEGPKRMLVYEYVDNGTLEAWLHGDFNGVSPLTWDIRMKIAVGTAKGIAYMHEGLEPKVVHRDIKSSNILLDSQWNPKVSDFGMAKLLSDTGYATTRVMGTFGYVAPEYAGTGILTESSDIYSFGVLLMEIISGRTPVDYNRPAGEVNLVDWFRGMVSARRTDELVDPTIMPRPSPRILNRVLLVCLRCIDADSLKRPKMGQIVHMLESDEFPFRKEHRSPRMSVATSGGIGSSPVNPGARLLPDNTQFNL